MADKSVRLSRSYEAHGETFDSITLREPTGADYWALGPIQELQPVGDGHALLTHTDTIKAYAERLIGDRAPGRLAVLDLADTLKVEAAVRDFFSTAMARNRPQTSSSGAPGKGSETSDS